MADEKDQAANGGGGQSCEEHEADGDGQGDTTLQQLPQPETLAEFLKQFPRHQIAPDKSLYKEGDPVSHIFYILFGKVEIRVAGEVIGVAQGPAVLGAEESHFCISSPTYVHTAVAVTPTSVVWLKRDDLRMVFRLDPNCAADYMKFQAALRRTTTERLAGYRGRVAKLGSALEQTQDALLERTPGKPRKLPPPPVDLPKKWAAQCQTIELLFEILGARAANLAELSAALDGLAAKYPEWAKQPDFTKFIRKFKEVVASDSKVDLATPPQR